MNLVQTDRRKPAAVTGSHVDDKGAVALPHSSLPCARLALLPLVVGLLTTVHGADRVPPRAEPLLVKGTVQQRSVTEQGETTIRYPFLLVKEPRGWFLDCDLEQAGWSQRRTLISSDGTNVYVLVLTRGSNGPPHGSVDGVVSDDGIPTATGSFASRSVWLAFFGEAWLAASGSDRMPVVYDPDRNPLYSPWASVRRESGSETGNEQHVYVFRLLETGGGRALRVGRSKASFTPNCTWRRTPWGQDPGRAPLPAWKCVLRASRLIGFGPRVRSNIRSTVWCQRSGPS